MNFLLKFIKNIIVKTYSYLIILNLYFLHRFYKRLYHNHSLGFGDSLAYLVSHYTTIKKDKKGLILDYGFITKQSIDFFFEKKKKIKLLFYIFKFLPHYNIISEFKKNNNFKPVINDKIKNYPHFKNKDSIKNLFVAKLNRSKNLNKFKNLKLFNKKYICISIKSYKIKDYFIGAGQRATYNLDTINKVIDYLITKGFDICILGLNSDHAVKEQKKKFKKNKKVKFLIDHFPDYNFDIQLFVALNSEGYLGSAGGISNLFYWLQKKNIFINCYNGNGILLNPKDPEQDKKFNKYLFKKVKINNKHQDLSIEIIKKVLNNYYEASKFDVKENSLEEIRLAIDEYIKKKFW